MPAKLTSERAVREALAARFEAPAYAVLPGVSDGTGHHKTRTVDAIVASLWPSRGLWIAGVEIKVSRNDLVRELANPVKQESVFKHCDYFWLAVGDESIVRDGDVPETWGLLVPARGGKKLKVAKDAPRLKPEPLSRPFLAAILRRADEQIAASAKELRAELRKEVEAQLGEELEQLRERSNEFHRLSYALKRAELVDRFMQRAGISLTEWNVKAIDEAADLVRELGDHGHGHVLERARHGAQQAKRIAAGMDQDADRILEAIEKFEVSHAASTEGTDVHEGRDSGDPHEGRDAELHGAVEQQAPDHAQG